MAGYPITVAYYNNWEANIQPGYEPQPPPPYDYYSIVDTSANIEGLNSASSVICRGSTCKGSPPPAAR